MLVMITWIGLGVSGEIYKMQIHCMEKYLHVREAKFSSYQPSFYFIAKYRLVKMAA